MTPQQQSLFDSIVSFDIDGGPVAFPFARRLARENNWSSAYTERALREYRRFLFLAAEAGHPVTPSEQVDEVWHLHMLYTDSYWNRLCKEVLPKPLHHGPTKGGKSESDKFTDWYAKTLDSYRRFFGEAPPVDIWPVSEDRFAPKDIRKIDMADHWVIRKPRWGWRHSLGVAGLTAALLVGCGASASSSRPLFVPILVVAIFAFVIVVIVSAVRKGPRQGCSTSCSTTTSCSSTWGDGHSHSHGHSHGSDHGGDGHGHSGCGSHGDGGNGCGSDGGSGCGSSCGSSCGGGGD